MKIRLFVFLFGLFMAFTSSAQSVVDTGYVATYEQKMSVTTFVLNSSIQVRENHNNYIPNYPLDAGVGFSLKNTVIDAIYAFSIVPLKSKAFGKTEVMDFQIHHYSRYFLLDLFWQNYKGFYLGSKDVTLYPEMAVQQIGGEGTYVFNGDKFSAKAAFDQSEKQLKSAGSFLLGGGMYLYKVGMGSNLLVNGNQQADNFQLGANAGYGYSKVINNHWLLSGTATVGANLGNEPELLKDGEVRVFPTAFARGAAVYNKADWAVSFSFLIHTKSINSLQDNTINITTIDMQLSYVKHFDRFFKKQKAQVKDN
ncbi:uncharacterized protein DUF4421 [Mucilaginibacter frigoritolerans]|uniref:Uncharacterized protein DUF4421 n=1 Tax=Mucilaginibacter frigoritolerans TaxID=652788 RepID=A0A562TWI3_9SPHI|nr:DUF4421 family protein [Mucilaginibacter frigoritolerans]TWI97230.1 uncharacterized protein DUF4421 [Mucilaginibacter frigoritolerans]